MPSMRGIFRSVTTIAGPQRRTASKTLRPVCRTLRVGSPRRYQLRQAAACMHLVFDNQNLFLQ